MSRSALIFAVMGLLVLFLIPYTRSEMKTVTGKSIAIAFKFLLIFIKAMWGDHVLIIKNLVSPRKVIYPTLENNDQVNLGS